jgi:hypothetical protein
MRFSLAAGIGLEFNDNIYLSDDNRESDFAIRPLADIDGVWRLTELNTLRFNIGVSYAKYFDHSDLDTDGVLVSPNSELSLTFYVGSIKFTTRHRVSYQEDTYDTPAVNAPVWRWNRAAGNDWQINQQPSHGGIRVIQSLTKGFATRDRSTTIYIRPLGHRRNRSDRRRSASSAFPATTRGRHNVMVGAFLRISLQLHLPTR